jgi:acylphosphatase
LKIVGMVENLKDGSVHGIAQGFESDVELFVLFLMQTGSPQCRIDRCQIIKRENIAKILYTEFSIKRK